MAQQTAKVMRDAKAIGTEDVLRSEAKAIHNADLPDLCIDFPDNDTAAPGAIPDRTSSSKREAKFYTSLYELNSAALCLSGGGIRSAAFALGVIQALAVHPRPVKDDGGVDEYARVGKAQDSLLAKFHYLSTVSGGGYIGSWLSAWVMRAGFPSVWRYLVGRPDGANVEPPVIAWLRAYSNYLTPKLGIMSADSWAAFALVVRNLMLNWLVILPVLCLVLLAVKLFAIAVAWFAQIDPPLCEPWSIAAAGASVVSLIVALRFTTRHRPTRGSSTAGLVSFQIWNLVPAVLVGILFTFLLASPCAHNAFDPLPLLSWTEWSLLVLGVPSGIAAYALGWLLGLPGGGMWNQVIAALVAAWRKNDGVIAYFPSRRAWWELAVDLGAWIAAGAVYGALMALGIYLYMETYGVRVWLIDRNEMLLVVLGVPWVLASQLFAEMIFVALSSSEKDSDADREWLGRAAGWYLMVALGWLVLMFLVFVGSAFANKLYEDYRAWAAGAGAGAITAWLGKSRFTPARGPAKDGKGLSANFVLAIAAPIFAVFLIVMSSALLDQLLFGQSLMMSEAFNVPEDPDESPAEIPPWPGGVWILIAVGLTLAVAVVASWAVNINRFSLHALYRNRLIRAFLGASHADQRKPNPFTDFDYTDNPRMSELWPPEDRWDEMRNKGWQPFHIVNIALNIVSTKRLAWQERKAEAFTVSSLHAGTACGGRTCEADGVWRAHGAFRPSGDYGGEDGISLGTAMAISGAAASPNMGYNSSPALAFLLTLFNVRLGWWLGNPASKSKRTYGSSGPRMAIFPLLSEMFGKTTDDSKYVYLSDGGHFENLGLYEMIRRRCRLIVVSDAGCDPDFGYEDLGNAVRKIALDLGVEITLDQLGSLRRRPKAAHDKEVPNIGDNQPYCAIGEIDYSVDGGSAKGLLLYVKPGYHGVEGADIRAYAVANSTFPHQTTGDQFFSESQFESYRALGFEIVDGFLNWALSGKNRPQTWSLNEIAWAFENSRQLRVVQDPGIQDS